MEEEISEEETKIDLNEENQDIVDKIFELKKLEKEKKFTYTMKADFKKKEEKEKLMGVTKILYPRKFYIKLDMNF